MKKRWILTFLLLYLAGIIGILVVSCTVTGDIRVDNRDSFRFISPDLEPKICGSKESTTHNYDDDEDGKE